MSLSMGAAFAEPRPKDIVDVKAIDPSIQVDLMYLSSMNFIGRPIRGYRENICFLTSSAARALRRAQARLRQVDAEYSLRIRDCYRPRKAVTHFMEWVAKPDALEMKELFYPDLTKLQLIEQGYIAPISGHSRASTVDLTIVRRSENGSYVEIPMGTRVDFFGERSRTDFPGISDEERRNRRLLQLALGPEFMNYSAEWWHYTLRGERYPNTYFDFDVAADSLNIDSRAP